MREVILLFNFTDREKRNKVTRALFPLRMKIKEIEKKDYLNPIGYLAGNKEQSGVEEVYTGEELEGEMLVMAGLSSIRMDQVLKALRKSGAGSIPYKASLTPTNQHWNVVKLFEEIKEEHERMHKEE